MTKRPLLNVEKEKILRIYEIKNGKDIFFEVSKKIRTDYINVVRKEFGVKRNQN